MPKIFVVDDTITDPPLFVQRRESPFVETNVPPGTYEVYNTRKMPGSVEVTRLENAPVTANPSLVVLERGQEVSLSLWDLVSGGVQPYSFSMQNTPEGFSLADGILEIDGSVASIGVGSAIVIVTGGNLQTNTIQVNYDVRSSTPPVFTMTETGFSVSGPGVFPDYQPIPSETSITWERP